MIVYRLTKSEYARDLSGKGAELAGGRWNSKGVPLLYTGQNIALCLVEVAVHLPVGLIPEDYELITLEIPNTSILTLGSKELTDDWNALPASFSTQKSGNEFAKTNSFLTLRVPSAVVAGEFNYLINPHHNNFKKVKLLKTDPFRFDSRLFK